MAPWLLVLPLVAQAPRIDDLLAAEWKVRNAAARELATSVMGAFDVDGLLRVLRTEWSGQIPEFGLMGGGGAGRRSDREPRARIHVEAAYSVPANGSWWHRPNPRISSADDLVVPWHPRALAAWLLEQRARPGSLPDLLLPLDDERLARVWLLLAAPNDEQVRRALANPLSGRGVAQALGQLGRAVVLQDALAAGDAATRRHVLAVGDAELLQRADGLAAAVDLFLRDDEEGACSHVALLAGHAGVRGIEALVTALRAVGNDERALARGLVFLCHCKDSTAGHEFVLAHIDHPDRATRHRALYVLGKEPVPTKLQADAATRLLQLVEGRTDRDTRLLAFDALGRCGAGVTGAQRRRLIGWLEKPPANGLEARVLGCLQMLGAAIEVPLATKDTVARQAFPTSATWLALADEGAPAAQTLADLLITQVPALDNQWVANRLAHTAPEVLRDWLVGAESRLQPIALVALRSLEPDSGVATTQLLTLLETAKGASNHVVEWLAERDDAAGGVERVFAWMAAHGDQWTPQSWQQFAAKHRLPTMRMLELLEPTLRQGHGWDLLADDDLARVRATCSAWFEEATTDAVRVRLAAVMARLGAETDDELAIVLAGLRAENPDKVLTSLEKAPNLPMRLRTRVEELLDSSSSFTQYLAMRALQSRRSAK